MSSNRELWIFLPALNTLAMYLDNIIFDVYKLLISLWRESVNSDGQQTKHPPFISIHWIPTSTYGVVDPGVVCIYVTGLNWLIWCIDSFLMIWVSHIKKDNVSGDLNYLNDISSCPHIITFRTYLAPWMCSKFQQSNDIYICIIWCGFYMLTQTYVEASTRM